MPPTTKAASCWRRSRRRRWPRPTRRSNWSRAKALFHGLRGDALKRLGRVAEAEKEYDEAIKRNGDYFAHYLNRGLARQQLGNKAGAQSDLEQANKLLPTAAAHYVLGHLAQGPSNPGRPSSTTGWPPGRFRGRAARRHRPWCALTCRATRPPTCWSNRWRTRPATSAADHQPQPGGIAQAARGGGCEEFVREYATRNTRWAR
jgi:tetratricopeptide (TPR) repeat protein